MEQEAPICRFCLDSRNTPKHRLIEPCQCRGSMRFVHTSCLKKWRTINPARNATVCLLCFTPYKVEYVAELEMLPNDNACSSFLLRYPIIICGFSNYMAAFHLCLSGYRAQIPPLFEQYQYGFQLLYFFLFYWMWQVKNKKLYWRLWRQKDFFFVFFLHVLSNYWIHQHEFFGILPLNIVMGYYWFRHTKILIFMNSLH